MATAGADPSPSAVLLPRGKPQEQGTARACGGERSDEPITLPSSLSCPPFETLRSTDSARSALREHASEQRAL